jgi:hypothetical protein
LGTDGAGLIRFDGTKFFDVGMDSSFNRHHISDIKEHKNHFYFSSRYKGIFKVKQNKSTCITDPKSYQGECLGLDIQDHGIILLSEKGICLNKDGKAIALKPTISL